VRSCLKSRFIARPSSVADIKRVLLESGAGSRCDGGERRRQHRDESWSASACEASPGRGDTEDKLLDALPEFEDWMRAEFQRAVTDYTTQFVHHPLGLTLATSATAAPA